MDSLPHYSSVLGISWRFLPVYSSLWKKKHLKVPGPTGQTPNPFVSQVLLQHAALTPFSAWQMLILWDPAQMSPSHKVIKLQVPWPLFCSSKKPSSLLPLASARVGPSAWIPCRGWLLLIRARLKPCPRGLIPGCQTVSIRSPALLSSCCLSLWKLLYMFVLRYIH